MPQKLLDTPLLVFVVSFFALYLSAWIGTRFQTSPRKLAADERDDYGIILGATLTLLGLIVGFSFSMAVGRYDQRKNYEEEEANAIGTEYLRADLLPEADAQQARALLSIYLNQRISFYETRNERRLQQLDDLTSQTQAKLWAVVNAAAAALPTPTVALAVAGMNDVLNRQGYTQAAWWNRIPLQAWGLMGVIAICSNLLLGFGVPRSRTRSLLVVIPLVLSTSFCLLADIDSPRRGFIRVSPQNLMSLSRSLHE